MMPEFDGDFIFICILIGRYIYLCICSKKRAIISALRIDMLYKSFFFSMMERVI